MKKFLVQYIQRLADHETGTYEPVGVFVRDRGRIIPVAIAFGDRQWENEQNNALRYGLRGVAPRELMDRLYDQNSTRVAYAKPVEVRAENPIAAAEKLHAKIVRSLL